MRSLQTKDREAEAFYPPAVYDVEAIGWNDVKILCHTDPLGSATRPKNRISFGTHGETHKEIIAHYIEWLFSTDNAGDFNFLGSEVWAHYGSGYDHRFLLEHLYSLPHVSVSLSMSAGKPIIITVSFDDCTIMHNGREVPRQIKLLDSHRLIPVSLDRMSKDLGLVKGHSSGERIDRHDIAGIIKRFGMKYLEDYCFKDCDNLTAGITHFTNIVMANGGTKAFTAASCASKMLRGTIGSEAMRGFYDHEDRKYYTGERLQFATRHGLSKDGLKPGMRQMNIWCRNAYFGGRTERYYDGYISKPGKVWDINSQYPTAMLNELPWTYTSALHADGRDAPTGALWSEQKRLRRVLRGCGIAEATVAIPKYSMALPVLPVRHNMRVIFPTGHFRGRWTMLELKALYDRMRDYPGFSMDIHHWERFSRKPFAAPFVNRLYNLRKQAKIDGNKADDQSLKILLNSAYGKLAENRKHSTFFFGEGYSNAISEAMDDNPCRAEEMPGLPGVYKVTSYEYGDCLHVAAASYITAHGRLMLLGGMERVLSQGLKLYNGDTDSIFTSGDVEGWGKTSELGAWDMQDDFLEAEFVCPKVYRFKKADGTWVHKAKGGPLKSQLSELALDSAHGKERRIRWLMYAQHISAPARTELAALNLTPSEVSYYERVDGGLVGLLTAMRGDDEHAPSLGTYTAQLSRMGREYDSKREHTPNQMSRPLHIGDCGDKPINVLVADEYDPDAVVFKAHSST